MLETEAAMVLVGFLLVILLGMAGLGWVWIILDVVRGALNLMESERVEELERQLAECQRSLGKAEQLAGIAWDWNLGDNGMVEIDGKWVNLLDLQNEFRAFRMGMQFEEE